MARVEGMCKCSEDGCACENKTRVGWVDVITASCRDCEIEHKSRWGKGDLEIAQGTDVAVDS